MGEQQSMDDRRDAAEEQSTGSQPGVDGFEMRQDLADGDVDGAIHAWEGAADTDGDEAASRDSQRMFANDDAPDDVAFGEDVAATLE